MFKLIPNLTYQSYRCPLLQVVHVGHIHMSTHLRTCLFCLLCGRYKVIITQHNTISETLAYVMSSLDMLHEVRTYTNKCVDQLHTVHICEDYFTSSTNASEIVQPPWNIVVAGIIWLFTIAITDGFCHTLCAPIHALQYIYMYVYMYTVSSTSQVSYMSWDFVPSARYMSCLGLCSISTVYVLPGTLLQQYVICLACDPPSGLIVLWYGLLRRSEKTVCTIAQLSAGTVDHPINFSNIHLCEHEFFDITYVCVGPFHGMKHTA